MTYSPYLGRFLEEDPTGFDAGDTNLYRFEGNDPVNQTDPDGLEARRHHPSRPPIWQWDWPGVSTKGDELVKAWGFGEDEMVYFRRGCVGLCAIRMGSYRDKNDPMFAPGVIVYVDLKDALAEQKRLNEKLKNDKESLKRAVLFSIESKNKIADFCEYSDREKKQINPKSLILPKLEPYDFATAFQKADGTIVYWERMPYGISKNPDLVVNRTEAAVYENVVYGVIVTDSKFQPHTVVPDDNLWRKRGKPRP